MLSLCQIFDPFALSEHIVAQQALQNIRALADKVQGQNPNSRKPTQTICKRNANQPLEAAVEQECHHGLTAGAKGEIGGVGVGVHGQHHRTDADQTGRQMPDIIGSVIEQREDTGYAQHHRTEYHT